MDYCPMVTDPVNSCEWECHWRLVTFLASPYAVGKQPSNPWLHGKIDVQIMIINYNYIKYVLKLKSSIEMMYLLIIQTIEITWLEQAQQNKHDQLIENVSLLCSGEHFRLHPAEVTLHALTSEQHTPSDKKLHFPFWWAALHTPQTLNPLNQRVKKILYQVYNYRQSH